MQSIDRWTRGRQGLIGAATVLALAVTLLGPASAEALSARLPVAPGTLWSPPDAPLSTTKSIHGHPVTKPASTKPHQPVPPQWMGPAAVSTPVAGSATVTLPAPPATTPSRTADSKPLPGAVRAGKLPVWLATTHSTGTTHTDTGGATPPVGASASAGTVQATVVDTAHTKAAGIHGLMLSVARTDAAAGAVNVQLGVDISSLDSTYGADASSRTKLVELPACSLTTPQVKGCGNATAVTSHYDPTSKRLLADLTLPASATTKAPTATTPAVGAARGATVAAAPMVLAAQTTSSGGNGSYAATSLQPSSKWTSGSTDGGFSYGYPITTPPALGGAAPQVALSYDSSSVDGRTSSTNSQSSIVGDGWDVSAGGFIERSYKSCSKDGLTYSSDECWGGYNATMSLDGHSGELVRDDTSGKWHLQGDDGTTIEFVTTGLTGGNGGTYGEYAKVSDSTGMVYYFGLDHLPGGDGTDPSNNSLWTVPVYSPKTGDPCNSTTATTGSWCQMGWRFNLAYAVDPHGNMISYKYTPEKTNYYERGAGQNQGTGTLTGYIPGGSLTRIDYGQTLAGQVAAKGAATPAASVLFNLAADGRCDTVGNFTCTGTTIDANTAAVQAKQWPDVPYDQRCAATGACTNWGPSFWSNQRLATITTQVQSAGKPVQVDLYKLTQTFQDPLDGTTPTLWLASIGHTGEDGPALPPLPDVTFTPVMLANRVDGINVVPLPAAFDRPRIQQIHTETGESINVDYNLPACSRTANVMPASPDTDTLACYSVLWYPPGSAVDAPPISDWFNRYTVKDVTENDEVGGAPQRITSYTYGNAAWHRDDSELTDKAVRTWDQFRGFDSVTAITGSDLDSPSSETVTYYAQGMDGDYKADGITTKSVKTVAGTLAGSITDSDWLAGQELETDTYNHADIHNPDGTVTKGTVASYTYTRTSGESVTATHVRGTGLPNLVARYDSTTSTTVSKALKTDGTWQTSSTTTITDPTNSNRVKTTDTTADGLPETCTRTSYATSTSNALLTGLVDETRTLSGAAACTATATKTNTVSDARQLYDSQPFGTAGAFGDATSAQALDHYDTSGNPVYLTTSASTYDSYGRVVTSTDPNATDTVHPAGAVTTTTYTPAAAGELPSTITTSTSAPGTATNWNTKATLDVGRDLALTSTDVNNKTSTATYDALGRITADWMPGHTTSQPADATYTYTVNGTQAPSTVTTATLGPAGTKRLSDIQIYNGFGQVTQTQSTPGLSSYAGRLISDTQYDSQGRTAAADSAWYNADSAPSTSLYATDSDQVPAQTTTTYDGQGRPLVSTLNSLGHFQSKVTTSYPGADETDVTPPAGATPTTTITDAAGRTSQLWEYHTPTATGQASDADVTSYTYTPGGQTDTRTDATTKDKWTYSYDLYGRQASVTDPDTGTSSNTYTADGQVATTTDGRGQTLTYAYDLLGRKTAEYKGTASAANEQAAWTYDTVTGGLGQPATAIRYVGGSTGTAYTQAVTGYNNNYQPTGNTTTIPGSVVGLTTPLVYTTKSYYDAYTGQTTGLRLPAEGGNPYETVNYSLDSNGPMIESDGASTYDLQTNYDAYGDPTRTTMNPWGSQVVSTYTYDPALGRVLSDYIDKQTATTGSVDQYNYTYNQAGQLTSAADIPDNNPANTDLQCYKYDYLGRLTTAWTDTGTTSTAPTPSIPGIGGCNNSSPTANPAPGKATTVGGPAAYWTDYGYDPTGNRTSEIQHDPAGNTSNDIRTSQVFPTPGTDNTPTTAPNTGGGTGGPHALMTTTSTGPNNPGASSYQYDAAGNTTAITTTAGTTALNWDAEDHLSKDQATGTSGATTYLYDADGNLLVQTDPTLTTVFLGSDQITYAPASGAPLQDTRYYAQPNGLTIVRQGAIENFQASDPHGTASLNIDANNLTETRRYLDPFGNPRGTTPANWTTANGFGDHGFVGGTQDPATGLTNIGAREYQPATGRFLNTDPVLDPTDPQQWNGYAYSNNEPTNASDPTGLFCDGCGNNDGGVGDTVGCSGDTGVAGCPGGPPVKKKKPTKPKTTTPTVTVKNGTAYLDGIRVPSYKELAARFVEYAAYPSTRPLSYAQLIGIWAGNLCSNTEGDPSNELALCASLGASGALDDGPDPWGVSDSISCLRSGKSCGTAAKKIGMDLLAYVAGEVFFGGSALADSADGAVAAAGDATTAAAADDAIGDLVLDACKVNSFPATTQVLLADESTKPISAIKIGDLVEATNPLTGRTQSEQVTAVIKTTTDTAFTDLTISTPQGDQPITSTQHHPYWDKTSQRWTNASDLHVGDQLRQLNGEPVTVRRIHDYIGHITTYNLTVKQIHTYYVLAGATPVLVHNDDGTMVGANGTQITSSTVWRGPSGMRIDVENPSPGGRPGQMHLQVQVNGMKSSDAPKYQYNFETGQFDGLPKNLQKDLAKTDFAKGVKKGLSFLGEAC
ncbi:polymorphic toxin-type HINT domain-containing protein [Streptacidiphilus cavernicola]|uniref:Polymorphic toxin-type HINT domain-containing protein n=1 Tax=Streptacidiphilus cavernicola TaxID=3342716 RepID=A0ABV6W4F6_9ACTN